MKHSFYSILAVLFFAGCSPDALFDREEQLLEQVPLEISSIQVEGDVHTRAGTTPLSGGKLGIFLTAGTGYTPAAYCYVGTGGGWSSSSPLMLGPAPATACAWYPYDYYVPQSKSDLANFPVRIQVYTPGTDLVYLSSINGINNTNPSLHIQLAHAHALLNFHISRSAEYVGAGNITGIGLSSSKLLKEAKYNIQTQAYFDIVLATALSFPVSESVPIGGTATIGLLMTPYTMPATTLKINVDGKEMSGNIPVAPLGLLQIGKCYDINVTLLRDLRLSVTVLPLDGTSGGEITW